MNYEQAMEYIHAVQWAGHKPGLTRTRTLLAALGDPHKQLRFVHVAGTNGKGSTAAMMASCLQAAGYRVGLYTSPFINRFNERIQINGVQIPDEELVKLVEQVKPAADAMEDVPTEFEIITALGMLYFAQQKCEIVVLEVGLGGTLDSTNVIDAPECAVITALGMDHVKELGPTLADIAAAKAGIIKEGCPVVSYGGVPEADIVIRRVCAEKHAELTEVDFSRLSIWSTSLSAMMLTRKTNFCPGKRSFRLCTVARIPWALWLPSSRNAGACRSSSKRPGQLTVSKPVRMALSGMFQPWVRITRRAVIASAAFRGW